MQLRRYRNYDPPPPTHTKNTNDSALNRSPSLPFALLCLQTTSSSPGALDLDQHRTELHHPVAGSRGEEGGSGGGTGVPAAPPAPAAPAATVSENKKEEGPTDEELLEAIRGMPSAVKDFYHITLPQVRHQTRSCASAPFGQQET